ncbi:DUF308 domain-containing protein [Nocardioides sp. GY 10127]|uniref:HdeD family acid-resistance protein n=1 Tax=Nocardioides sp. GY 10127 TaxID=2569762 RepID=UPI0010A84563|nr:DUF308 domain-containing protein [Nocardioides sp. GY 10127]TIC85648.1 hypothetical protein E8D37_03265 [Nocardioides sp. GY 10127]
MEWLDLSWRLLVVRGLVALAAGVAMAVWPMTTVSALAIALGAWAVVDGVVTLLAALVVRGTVDKVVLGILGVGAVTVGAVALARPFQAGAALTMLLGAWLVAAAFVELLRAVAWPRVSDLAVGVLGVLAGVLLVLNPGRGALTLTVALGAVLAAIGVVWVVAGALARREALTVC